MITAPFNFVPLSEEVFFPDWSNGKNEVSHDVPYEDSQSGVLDITITAKSPIFIRNHSSDKNNPSTEFCNHNGEYYIPSTSVKGMVRSVLEIMSFSKMSQFDDDTYAVRDLSSAKNFYMTQMREPLYCGWLKKTQDGFSIEDCGVPARIRHEEIDKALNIDFASHFKNDGFEKTSEFKYEKIGGTPKIITVGELYKSTTNAKYDKRQFCRYDKDGKSAILVVTGQASARKDTGKMGDGKGFEFIFFESKKELKVTKETMDNFLFAYFDKRKTEPKESQDWKFWKEKLENGDKVPVFFQKEGAEIAHFGLSYLYKLPYKHSVEYGIPKSHKDTKQLDLAQTIFGYVNKKEALKGRVEFSHFKATTKPKPMQERTEILGTPRASYYPIYVRQSGTNPFTTFMDEFSIAGWKRYPIHKTNKTVTTEKNENKKVGTKFSPLNHGVIFKGKLRYHNLKKAELGAILSSLTFHNSKDTYHNIGMAKSLGYGKIDIKIEDMQNVEEYLKAFELEMASNVSNWAESEQIQELLTMATEQNNSGNSKLKYMELSEFASNKTKTDGFLKKYSELTNIQSCTLKRLVSQIELEEEVKKLKEQEEKEVQDKALQEELDLLMKSQNIQLFENFISKNPEHPQVDNLIAQKEALQKAQEADKFQAVNETFKKAYDALLQKKSNPKQYQKEREKFIKKWEAKKNNKGSDYILDLVEQVKKA